jgi:hypothetical protein
VYGSKSTWDGNLWRADCGSGGRIVLVPFVGPSRHRNLRPARGSAVQGRNDKRPALGGRGQLDFRAPDSPQTSSVAERSAEGRHKVFPALNRMTIESRYRPRRARSSGTATHPRPPHRTAFHLFPGRASQGLLSNQQSRGSGGRLGHPVVPKSSARATHPSPPFQRCVLFPSDESRSYGPSPAGPGWCRGESFCRIFDYCVTYEHRETSIIGTRPAERAATTYWANERDFAKALLHDCEPRRA